MSESKSPVEEGEDDERDRDDHFCWNKELLWSANILWVENTESENTYEYQSVHSGCMESGMVVEIFPRFH